MKKKNIIGIIVLICLLLIGFSFGYYLISKSQESNNIAGSKCFKLELTNQSKKITLDPMYPISDEEGMSLTPYTFTLTNTCNIDASYSINLEMLEGTTLDSKYLDVVLNDSGIKLLTSYNTTNTVITGSTESRTLTTGSLRAKESKDYTLRFWMDKDVEDTNSMNKVFKSKIVVSAEATVIYPTLVEKVTELSSTDTVNFASDDPDNNIRYIGANPDNYVYFNCSDYNKQSSDTCEKWRIIGLFNNITKSDGSKENLIKIIRDETIGAFSWDYTSAGSYTNDWSTSSLQELLNNFYYEATKTTYYNNTTTASDIDFASIGLKNDLTRNAIENVIWNLGSSSTYDDVTPKMFYERERANNVYGSHQTTWTGKIGLMYPSDYGYATSGNTTNSRSECLGIPLYNWSFENETDCKNNNYLYKSTYAQWFLESRADTAIGVFDVYHDGGVNAYTANGIDNVRPSLYLKSNISIIDGNGSEESPFQLKVG